MVARRGNLAAGATPENAIRHQPFQQPIGLLASGKLGIQFSIRCEENVDQQKTTRQRDFFAIFSGFDPKYVIYRVKYFKLSRQHQSLTPTNLIPVCRRPPKVRPCNRCGTPVDNARLYCVDCEQQAPSDAAMPSASDDQSDTLDDSDSQFVMVRLLQLTCGGILIGGIVGAIVCGLSLGVFGLSMKVAVGIALAVGGLVGGALVFSQVTPG